MKPRTAAIHAGTRLGSKARPLVEPIYASSVSWFDSAVDLDASLDGGDFVYARIASPNAALLEEAIAALEGAETCVTYGSGMAACRAIFEAQPFEPGDCVVIAADGYGATRALFRQLCEKRGLSLVPIDLAAHDAPARIEQARPKLVLAESITNPLVSVPDLSAVAKACRKVSAHLAVDNTFATPLLQRALALGADYSLQSTTKWIDGHGDALGGAVSGLRSLLEPMRERRTLDGAVLGPFEAWLTLRGLRTLPVRMKAICESAMRIAQKLAASERIARVFYPGLPADRSHAVARQMLDVGAYGYGGMLAFEIRGAGRKEAFAFLEAVRLCRPAPSLGDVTTLVMHPATASARRMTPEEREAAGITEGMIRVSVGLEDPDDVVADLLRAVEQAQRTGRGTGTGTGTGTGGEQG